MPRHLTSVCVCVCEKEKTVVVVRVLLGDCAAGEQCWTDLKLLHTQCVATFVFVCMNFQMYMFIFVSFLVFMLCACVYI